MAFAVLLGASRAYAGEPWWDADVQKKPFRRQEAAEALVAYKAFARGDYDKALAVLKSLSVSPCDRTSLKTLIATWEKRQRLGHIEPKYVYKALVANITAMDVTYNGRRYQHSMTPQERDSVRLNAALTQKTYEAFTDGQMTVQFDIVDLDGPLKGLTYGDDPMPRHDTAKGLPELLLAKSADYDVIVIHWPRGVTGTALGGVWAVPYVEYAAYGPRRGRLILNSIHDYGVWVHELFHSFEGNGGIKHIHGYYEAARKFFPGWKGVSGDQFDYFQWQFATTLKKVGYQNLLFRTRNKRATPDDVVRAAIKEYSTISPQDKYEADELYFKGRHARGADRQEALLRKALALSPRHSSALAQLAPLLAKTGRLDEALKVYDKAVRYFPRPSVMLGRGRLLKKMGKLQAAQATFDECAATPSGDSIESNRAGDCVIEAAILYDKLEDNRNKAYAMVLALSKTGYSNNTSRDLLFKLMPESLSPQEAARQYHNFMGDTPQFASMLTKLAGREKDPEKRFALMSRADTILAGQMKQDPDNSRLKFLAGLVNYQVGLYYESALHDRNKAYQRAKMAIGLGYSWNRVVELMVRNLPPELTNKQARRELITTITDGAKLDYGLGLLSKRHP